MNYKKPSTKKAFVLRAKLRMIDYKIRLLEEKKKDLHNKMFELLMAIDSFYYFKYEAKRKIK